MSEERADPLPLGVKIVIGLAVVDAALLSIAGLAFLSAGGRAGTLVGSGAVVVAVGQGVSLVALYRRREWALNAVLAFLLAGALLFVSVGDLLGVGVSLLVAGYLYSQRDRF
ncbi:MAG: hypothetical protein ABEJ05_11865 [Haloglomus sp.]